LIDMAPTFLEIAEVNNAPQMSGKSLTNLLFSKDMDYRHRDYVLTGRERHTHARPGNLGYPARAIRTADYLYVRNFMPDRWPAGDPTPKRSKEYLKPKGFKSIEPGFNDVDNSPTKSFLIDQKKAYLKEYDLAYSKRSFEQLYDIKIDPGCINNIADEVSYKMIKKELSSKLEELLKAQGDPRVLGYGDIFDSYPRISSMRDFSGFHERGEYNPEYLQEGQEKIKN
jgi:N-sulfoglucosamine sulfohydrolase